MIFLSYISDDIDYDDAIIFTLIDISKIIVKIFFKKLKNSVQYGRYI